MAAERRWSPIGILLAVGALALLVVVPLWKLIEVGTQELAVVGPEVLSRASARGALANTLVVGVAVAALAVALGTGAALITERVQGGGRPWLRLAVILPLVIPGYVSALSFIRAYGPSGLTDDLAGVTIPGLFGPVGIIIVLAVNAVPIAFLVVAAALRSRAEPDLERAATVHGADRLTVARTIMIPLLAPALLGAAALVFVSAINAFGVPAFLGTPAGFATVTTRIYQDLALAARPEAFTRAVLLAIFLVAIALVFVLVAERLLTGMGRSDRTGETAGPPPTERRSLSPLAWLLVGVVILSTVLPLLTLVATALTRAVGLAPVPANWTLANFAEAVQGRFLEALVRSLLLAALAATIVIALGSLVASVRRSRFGPPIRAAVLLTFAVPGSTLAVAMLLAYGASLRDTLLLILLAYLAKLWGVGHRVIEGAAGSVPPDMYRAARASGASATAAIATVVAPILRPALVGGWLLVFVFAFHELTMSSLLYGPGTTTLAVVVLNLQQLGDVLVASAVAILLTVPVLAVAIPALAFAPISRRIFGGGR